MKYVDEYRSPELVHSLLQGLRGMVSGPIRIMEVCGTHTMSIFRHGLRQMLPPEIHLVSGPGCPVCVTPQGIIDAFIAAAGHPRVIITTFGDMMRVPGSSGSLADARASGADVRIVYSPADAVQMAIQNPEHLVVFLSVGFETTTPLIAASILEASRRKIENFCVFPANKTMPPPLRILMQDPALKVDGLLCPGHVSVITGSDAFSFLPEDYGLACAVAGFEPADILYGIAALAAQIESGQPCIENCYGRAVTEQGNLQAKRLVQEVFQPADAEWRGLGTIEKSGLDIREEYSLFDVTKRLNVQIMPSSEPAGCMCGSILKGISQPPDCPLFKRACSPASPVGPCMVSNEGTCSAWYRFGAVETGRPDE